MVEPADRAGTGNRLRARARRYYSPTLVVGKKGHPEPMYQMYAYGREFRSPRTILLYPRWRGNTQQAYARAQRLGGPRRGRPR